MNNKIKTLRTKQGLSQKQLAKLSGTSQQQIQRIESGRQTARFDIAVKICGALDSTMEQVFPETRKTLIKARKTGVSATDYLLGGEGEEEMLAAGIDTDPRSWTMAYMLRSGARGGVAVEGLEHRRLFNAVQGFGASRFVVFDTDKDRVALNLEHLVFCHFLYEAGFVEPEKGNEEDGSMVVHTVCSPEPLTVDVDADSADLEEEPDADDGAQLQHMFGMLEASHEQNGVISFMDMDGERVFLRETDLEMVSVPLWAVEPGSYSDEIEEDG